jgi:hypothetical protein
VPTTARRAYLSGLEKRLLAQRPAVLIRTSSSALRGVRSLIEAAAGAHLRLRQARPRMSSAFPHSLLAFESFSKRGTVSVGVAGGFEVPFDVCGDVADSRHRSPNCSVEQPYLVDHSRTE